MGQTRVHRLAFNRGLVSRLGVARADIKRLAWACTTMTNWMTRVLGSMMLRPGLGYITGQAGNNKAKYIPHIFAVGDASLVEITAQVMRVIIDDVVLTRPAVSTAVTNGSFTGSITGWTNSSNTGGASPPTVQAGTGNTLQLNGNAGDPARATQAVTVAAADQGVEHALRIVVTNGPVGFRVGTALGDDSYVSLTTLETGQHSISFTPSGNFTIEFQNTEYRSIFVDACTIEAAGIMTLTVPWLEADLGNLRWEQSGDVLFVGCTSTTVNAGYQQYRIERRGTRPHARSWSAALYRSDTGPFRVANVGPIVLSGAQQAGNLAIGMSQPYFKAGHLGALFKVNVPYQGSSVSPSANGQVTGAIEVTDVGTNRDAKINITTLTGSGNEVLLQRAPSKDGPWATVTTYTTDQASITYNDTFDNGDWFYRLSFNLLSTLTGTTMAISIARGQTTAVLRITAVNSAILAQAEALVTYPIVIGFSALTTYATTDWSEGKWSDYRGWPSAVALNEGRLCWAGRDQIDMSVSDAFDDFNPDFEGDAAPIGRSIGSGPVDTINWLLPLQRLILGAQAAAFSVRSSSLDEVVTPTNFNMKKCSTQGSAAVPAQLIDQMGVFVQNGGTRLFELAFGQDGIDYAPDELSKLIPEIGEPGIVRMAVQRKPDTRLHCVRSDGTAFVLVFDKTEQVICFLDVETLGEIEDVVVLPTGQGIEEDYVYYSCKRTFDAAIARSLEKWAFEAECRGGQLNKQADCYLAYTGVPTVTVTAAHLANQSVVIWADGIDVGTADDYTQTYTLDALGQCTLPAAASNYVVGLAYSAPWKSSRLAETMAQGDGALTSTAKIKGISMILADVHPKGLRYGQSLDTTRMDDLPGVGEEGEVVGDTVRADYTLEPSAFQGTWNNDARLCLLAQAPRPVTVLATPLELEYHG